MLAAARAWESSGTEAAVPGSREGGPGDPVLNHPQPISVYETGRSVQEGQPLFPPLLFLLTLLLVAMRLCRLPQPSNTSPWCKSSADRIKSLLPSWRGGWESACIAAEHAYGVSIPQQCFSSPSSSLPHPCPNASVQASGTSQWGTREGDKACEMAGNLPAPACRPLAILLTSPSPERIDASAFELL